MDRKQQAFDKHTMVTRTHVARSQVEAAVQRARDLDEDSDKTRRLARQFCKACHYFPRLAAQASAVQPCACCSAPQQYSSSATDALCPPCAKTHSLCKHCGGDLEMRTGRRNWPAAPELRLAAVAPAPLGATVLMLKPTSL